MRCYDLTVFKRVVGAPGRSDPVFVSSFEALDVEAACDEAYRRTRVLPPGHYSELYDATDRAPDRSQLGNWKSPGA